MSLQELEDLVSTLTESEREVLRELLNAANEGVSVEEFRAINRALDEAINEPSSRSAEDVFAELRTRCALNPSDAQASAFGSSRS